MKEVVFKCEMCGIAGGCTLVVVDRLDGMIKMRKPDSCPFGGDAEWVEVGTE